MERLEGEQGDFSATLVKRPRYIIEEKCTGCTTCMEYCPVKYPDKFNQEISENKAVHIYFSQAIPLVSYIDDSCLYLKEKKCLICEGVCKTGAIDFHQKPVKTEINVGAVVLSVGLEPFDPETKEEYRYGKFRNVVTSMDYERLLSSTGPYAGEVLRASDKKHPHRVAWIQCVGSRRVTPGENTYCSGVCCTYTQKQVILTKDHDAFAKCTVFHNDIRSFGKDFERYFQRAEKLPGVRFIRSYASIVREDPDTHSVFIRYDTPDEGVKEEEFDLLVLSVGPEPARKREGAGRQVRHRSRIPRFLPDQPAQSHGNLPSGHLRHWGLPGSHGHSRIGLFRLRGRGPSAGSSSTTGGASSAVSGNSPRRRMSPGKSPGIGIFVCHCGANISGVVNVPAVVEYALTLPNVVHAQAQIFSCATNSAGQITDIIKEKSLNRVIVAACSPRTLEPLFRDTVLEAGINQYYLEMANIREHNSWVHSKEKEASTEKAKDIVRMSAARARFLEPLEEFDLPVNKTALVVGGGLAGLTCALSIANQGHTVLLGGKGPGTRRHGQKKPLYLGRPGCSGIPEGYDSKGL